MDISEYCKITSAHTVPLPYFNSYTLLENDDDER